MMEKKKYVQVDLFMFAYIPDWYKKLDELADMAMPEPWKFKEPYGQSANTNTPILERYIREIFRLLATAYNAATDQWEEQNALHISNRNACFNTGLFTRDYKPIYAVFEPNKRIDSILYWHFSGFADENSTLVKYIAPLPKSPLLFIPNKQRYNPGWMIRINARHILEDSDNQERIPEELRGISYLPFLLETAAELGRRRAMLEPSLVVPQLYRGKVQYLIPISFGSVEKVDLAMTLSIKVGYYQGETCLLPWMAYVNARLIGRPTVSWLVKMVE